jgi:hypothetical protein
VNQRIFRTGVWMAALALAGGCGMLPGSSPAAPPSTPIGPLNANYSNAISPAQQLIIGTMNLKGNLVISPDEATQLVPLWEAYATLATSNSAAPQELQADLVQIEQTMTPDQVQAIVDMKLTRQDMGAVFQAQGITFGPRGTGTPGAGGFGGGRNFGGGGGGPVFFGGGGGGGFGGGGATPNPQAIATFQARRASGAANVGLVRVLIRFLEMKNPALLPTRTPVPATEVPSAAPSETPTP